MKYIVLGFIILVLANTIRMAFAVTYEQLQEFSKTQRGIDIRGAEQDFKIAKGVVIVFVCVLSVAILAITVAALW